MNRVSFESDYNNGAHPEVLRHLIETNGEKSQSYGYDEWSESARKKIRIATECPDAAIYFLAGGTQANATVIDALLRPYQGVLAVESAHINVHEAGAVEASGHKILTLPSHNGLMDAQELRGWLERFYADPTWEHMVVPGVVYITFPSELGTLYDRQTFSDIYAVCQEYQLKLFVDGARLGYGLAARECDITLPWLAHHCDAFYIGGTKVGALCGEAVVFPKGDVPQGFFSHVKTHGALLAKSRVAGVQFDALFTDNLYFRIGDYAIDMAHRLRDIFERKGYKLLPSPTNQQFVVLENSEMERLRERLLFETWEVIDEAHTLCRFVTSWATSEEDLEALDRCLLRESE